VPEAVKNLLQYSGLKTLAEQIGVEAIDRRHNVLNIKFHKETRVDPQRLMAMVAKTKGASFSPAGVLLLPLDGTMGAGEILRHLGDRLAELKLVK
jgi:transcription-repair coupling factor (superfamily II helicase)